MSTAHDAPRRRWLGAAFAVGFASLVYEVASAKILFLFFVESSHAVALTLSAFLAGLATSSLLFSRVVHRGMARPERVLAAMQLFSAGYAFGVLRRFDLVPHVVDAVTRTLGVGAATDVVTGGFAFVYLFFPGFFVGGAFPILTGLYLRGEGSGTEDTGVVYFWDTAGAIVGAWVAGFVLLPELGIERTLLAPIAVNLALMAALLVHPLARTAGAALALVSLGAMLAPRRPVAPRNGADARGTGSTALSGPAAPISGVASAGAQGAPDLEARFGVVLESRESPFGRVTVGEGAHGVPGNRALFINYRDMCHSLLDESELTLGSVTAGALHVKGAVLSIGLGCGMTASALAESASVERLDVAEINPVVAEMTRRWFGELNHHVLESKKTRLLLRDGAEVLRQAGASSYAAIVIDIEEPTIIHSSPLYTVEYARIAREKLLPGGVLAIWMAGAEPDYGRVLYNTVAAAFEHVSVRVVGGSLHVYGSDRPLDIRPAPGQETAQVAAVMASPVREANTLDDRALERFFDVRKAFHLPRSFQEPVYVPVERDRL